MEMVHVGISVIGMIACTSLSQLPRPNSEYLPAVPTMPVVMK